MERRAAIAIHRVIPSHRKPAASGTQSGATQRCCESRGQPCLQTMPYIARRGTQPSVPDAPMFFDTCAVAPKSPIDTASDRLPGSCIFCSHISRCPMLLHRAILFCRQFPVLPVGMRRPGLCSRNEQGRKPGPSFPAVRRALKRVSGRRVRVIAIKCLTAVGRFGQYDIQGTHSCWQAKP